ncbi:MAG: DUF6265 family protein [Gammaproteobacteria bacterium]|nr:DUF6265 family protein [Gammaproteobacteria bacterium]
MNVNRFCSAATRRGAGLFLLAAVLLSNGFTVAARSLADASPLAAFAFMQGCWSGDAGEQGLRIDEYYGAPQGGLLLGQVMHTDARQVVFFEFLRIEATADGIWLTPWPMGRLAETRFKLMLLQDDRAVFENPAHDFPQRIEYRLLPGNSLLTRIAGERDGEARVEEYQTRRTACR